MLKHLAQGGAYYTRVGEFVKFVDHLSKADIQKFNSLRKTERNKEEPKPKPKRKENLTERDLVELMGIHQDTYERRRGAVRRK